MEQAERLARLEARLAQLEEVEHIRELLSTYGFNADLGRTPEYLDGWTEDGLYDLTEELRFAGRAELERLVADPDGMHKREIENRSQHLVANLVIRVEGDTAWAEGYSLVPIAGKEAITIMSLAYNHWDFVRSDDRWLMKRRLRRTVGGPTWGGEVIKSYLEAAAS